MEKSHSKRHKLVDCPLFGIGRARSMRMGFVMQRWKVRNPHRIERKYTEVAGRDTPIYCRQNLSENLGTPVKTCTAVSYWDSNENLKTWKLRGLQLKLENRSPQIF